MRFHTIEDILAANQNACDRFTASVSGLNEGQLSYRPGEDQWSISEIAEHVSIVSNGFLRVSRKLLRNAEENAREPRPDLDLGSTSLDDDRSQPRKFKAPESVHPSGNISLADALESLRQTLDGFVEIKCRLEDVDLSEEVFPHPAFGQLNTYQWMILLGEHTDRHRDQIESIKESPSFPS